MEENFDTYGQISPLSVKFNFNDPQSVQLDHFAMNQTLGYFNEQRQILEAKQKQIAETGAMIANERQKIENSSYLNESAKIKAREEYMVHVNALKEHYKIPKSERGVDWYRDHQMMATNINSQVINNDLKNKELFDRVSQMAEKGIISGSSFKDWYADFKSFAENGQDYSKSSVKYNGGIPITAHENLLSTAQNLIGMNGFKSFITNEKGDITGIAPSEWKDFMENKLIPGAYEDAYSQFKQLPEEMQRIYMGDEGDEVEGTKQYIRALFDNARYSFNTVGGGRKSRSGSGGDDRTPVDAFATFWEDNLNKAPILGEKDNVDEKEQVFYAQNVDMLRGSTVNGVIKNFRIKIPGQGTLIIDNFRIDDANNIDYIKDSDKRNEFVKIGAHKTRNGNGIDMGLRMHDQSVRMTEQAFKSLIQNNLRPDKSGYRKFRFETLDGSEAKEISNPTVYLKGGNIPDEALAEYMDRGTYDILTTNLEGKSSVIPGSRKFRINGLTVDKIHINGLSKQVINSAYAQTAGASLLGKDVSMDAEGSYQSNNGVRFENNISQ